MAERDKMLKIELICYDEKYAWAIDSIESAEWGVNNGGIKTEIGDNFVIQLAKYKDEIEKRTVAETNFKALYANCVQNGWITPPTQEHKDNCDCEECKDKLNDQK